MATCKYTILSSSCIWGKNTLDKTIPFFVLAVPTIITKKYTKINRQYSIVSTLHTFFDKVKLKIPEGTSCKTVSSCFAYSGSFHSVLYRCKPDCLAACTYRHGLINCWKANTATFSLSVKCCSHIELSTSCNFKEQRKKS